MSKFVQKSPGRACVETQKHERTGCAKGTLLGRSVWLGAKSHGGEVGHGDEEVGKNQIPQHHRSVLSSSDYSADDGEADGYAKSGSSRLAFWGHVAWTPVLERRDGPWREGAGGKRQVENASH